MSENIIEISEWQTPFQDGNLSIVSLDWGYKKFSLGRPKGYEYETKGHDEDYELSVVVFHLETEHIYAIKFPSADTFRILDEGGLLSIWSAKDWREKAKNTVKIRGHEWSKESPLSFFHNSNDGWSFLIATSMECVEIVTTSEPDISLVEKIELKETITPSLNP